ncbi:hypothetical protein N9W84_00320 [bacterium]|nr:hypothetical protein [bacterium]
MNGVKQIGSFEEGVVAKQEGRNYVRMYLNPESVGRGDTKIISEQQTKGGFAVQYWGEQLTSINITGTTGSSGIEGINVLRSIYRHEQLQFKNILQDRLKELKEDYRQAAVNRSFESKPEINDFGSAALAVGDFFLGGVASQLVKGDMQVVDALVSAFTEPPREQYSNFSNTPSLAALATSIDMYYQGETFRGFFTNMNFSEQASTPGIFNYNMTFKATLITGVRKNFMPWHRNPISPNGSPISASIPTEGARPDELSVPYTNNQIVYPQRDADLVVNNLDRVRSTIREDQASPAASSLPLRPANRRRQ